MAVVVDEGTLLGLAGHETDLRFRPCLPRCTDSDSAIYNADVDTDRKGSNDVWLAQEGLRVRSEHGVLVWVGDQETSEKTVEGLLTWEDTRGQILCQGVNGG